MTSLPNNIVLDNLIEDLRSFSWEAFDILLFYSRILKDSSDKSNIIKTKEKGELVTIADLKVNELIIHRINERYKKINWQILTEENVKIRSKNSDFNSNWLWVLDRLDGTMDYVQGTENYAMHLALNYKNQPYIGIVLIPERNELWISTRSKVWCENRDGVRKEASLSNNKILNNMTIVTSKNHKNENLNKLIKLINFKNVVVMGSVGCKIASILRGESEIYISLNLPGKSAPKDWDFAAPAAILLAAGGAITNLENESLSYNQENFEQGGIIIATSNKNTHREICLQIKEIINKNKLYPLKT